ncbi:MAG: hypothetical protein JOZ87_04705 [Chloroflexi bacterium]|nr:hypothetical protein [Chloroflexota bacterium]
MRLRTWRVQRIVELTRLDAHVRRAQMIAIAGILGDEVEADDQLTAATVL